MRQARLPPASAMLSSATASLSPAAHLVAEIELRSVQPFCVLHDRGGHRIILGPYEEGGPEGGRGGREIAQGEGEGGQGAREEAEGKREGRKGEGGEGEEGEGEEGEGKEGEGKEGEGGQGQREGQGGQVTTIDPQTDMSRSRMFSPKILIESISFLNFKIFKCIIWHT